jgi:hypothetical protein
MPLLYGEGEVKAFQRLREAIDKPLKGMSYPYDRCLTHLTRLALTRVQALGKTYFVTYRMLKRRLSTYTIAKTNLPASLTRASTCYKRYMTGLMERMDKMSDVSFG